MTGASDSDSVVAPFFGGYKDRLDAHIYYNTAIFLSPGT
jgi:hypothetical protein